MSTLILRAAVFLPLYQQFDYLAPENMAPGELSRLCQPGVRLKLPWGKREIIGILLETASHSPIKKTQLKHAIAILDEAPLFGENLLKLIRFSSEYYHHPIGEVFEAALPALLRQGKAAHYRKEFTEPFEDLPEMPPVLNQAQSDAVEIILKNSTSFLAYLLYGVTGSGKTEVYLQIIEKIIAQKKQALILVPEIGLTPQTVSRFEKRFLVKISVLHSGLTDRERLDSWMQAKNGDVSIIIGTRSAIFTPLYCPGIIILDEEHDMSFKQQEGFRYSARDLALMRAQLENIPVVLGSATPSLESFYNAMQGRYQLITLADRAGLAIQPDFRLIDMKKQIQKKNQALCSETLKCIEKHLSQKGQALVFLNRRGFASVLICAQCGWVAECKRCDAKMTVHQGPNLLQCHHCLASRKIDKTCMDCGEKKLTLLGAGTERLEAELGAHFKDVNIIRIDRDTTRKKGTLQDKLNKVHSGEPCILVGTQMLAKGHHFSGVTLSVIMNIDSSLYSADFRGIERAAQLIFQVGGRAGRAEKKGEVILQTYHPEHPLLNILLTKGYDGFIKAALLEREETGFPPYQYLAMVRAEATTLSPAIEFLTEVKKFFSEFKLQSQYQTIELLGPIPAPMQKRSGKHRAQLLCQSPHRKQLKSGLEFLVNRVSILKSKNKVRWSIDVDPQEMF